MEETAETGIAGGGLGGVQGRRGGEMQIADRAQAGGVQGNAARLGDSGDRGSEAVTEAVDVGDGVGVELAESGEAGDGGNG